MKLEFKQLPTEALPALAWVAQHTAGAPEHLDVFCGELVEKGDNFVVEGVWPGAFTELEFVASELFYGSGLRVIDDEVYFVSSCSTVDRLWVHQDAETITVSNSLPCLLAAADIDLIESNSNYASAVETIVKGRDYQKDFPVSRGTLQVHYFENICLTSGMLQIKEKGLNVEPFLQFEDYSRFLYETALAIGDNARDPARRLPVEVITTVSKGYDSPVSSLLAKKAGATKALTLKAARSVFPREDSGKEIADLLGLQCKEYVFERKNILDEKWYWAANGSLQDMNFSVFSYPKGPSVLFTGFNGDMVWSKEKNLQADFLKRKDSTGLGFCEHRLVKGVIHCPVPYWGIRHVSDIKKISNSDYMTPWSVAGDYDRPVPRRLVEEVGIPRTHFGIQKSATTIDDLVLLPVSPKLKNEYQKFLKLNNIPTQKVMGFSPMRTMVDVWRSLFRQRIIDLTNPILNLSASKRTFGWEDYLFPWANQSLKPKKHFTMRDSE
ncbi:hypothetical protein [Alteromonas ponticola]|uniref:Asparagine synthetase domain-containing protein n=1 Tax=Alteromonas ponticola TaxID=2720613 RepID=A0ABX1R736_9ALTE|nr:hypothetical protein [Alteromonas ponticola]NMH61501.1 hypothetical protein [Alteromonas ponticola]